jgi:GWxTD domain-containing protein
MRILSFIAGIAVFICLIFSCTPVRTTSESKTVGLGSIYNPFVQPLHPEYFVHHSSDNQSRLYLKLNLSELMFSPIGPNKSYISKIKIEYKVYAPGETEIFTDSASMVFEISRRKGENSAITYFTLNDRSLSKYFLRINATDLFKQSKAEDYILVNKEDENHRQNFLINLNSTNYPYFNPFFSEDQSFTIQYNKPVPRIHIRYFGTKPQLPYPPYSTMSRGDLFSFSDSSWTVSGQAPIDFSNKTKGFYYFQTDSAQKFGLGLLNAGISFPYIKNSDDMIAPLEYLMNTGEYNKLLNEPNKKLAIDQFWLSSGKSNNRARELIRIFYNRTFFSNVYFTSFTEGWRTDRGMVYIIFGPPKSVKKMPGKEIWFYYDRSSTGYLQLTFNKFPNPFSENDFVLERHMDFRQFWFKAINSWRSGKVYTVFD